MQHHSEGSLPLGAEEFNDLSGAYNRPALPTTDVVRHMEPLADVDGTVLLITRLTILKAELDKAISARW